MSDPSSSSVYKALTLLKPKDPKFRPTVLPFIPVYAIILGCIMDPVTVWGEETYEDWGKVIDFANAVAIPLLAIFHVFCFLLTKWIPTLRARTDYSPATKGIADATHVLVEVHEHKGQPGIVEIQFDSGLNCKCFFFQQAKFIYEASTGKFVRPVYPDDKEFGYYHGLSITSASHDSLVHRRNLYGPNEVDTVIPSFQEMLADHMMAPFFVFQIFCVMLWMLDEYWMVALMNGGLMVVLEATVVMQRQRQMKQMRDMGSVPTSIVYVRRDHRKPFFPMKSTDLLPGDVVLIGVNPDKNSNNANNGDQQQEQQQQSASSQSIAAPADMVIVQGSAVLNEATLTGESTPQLKQGISAATADSDKQYSDARHASNTIFNGTQILSSGGFKGDCVPIENVKKNKQVSVTCEGALAVVLRTGFDTKQGQLMRTIAHSQSRVSQNSGEAFGFIGLLLVFACIASTYVLRRGLADPTKSRWKLFLTCTQIITSVVPPELPMQLTLAVNTSLVALMKLKVFCTEPFRIPFAGKVNCCCFDKTGTLTTDEMLFAGIHEDFESLDAPQGKAIVSGVSHNANLVIGACHSLVALDDGKSAGDAMEKSSADALGWKVDNKNDKSSNKDKRINLTIRHRYAFDSVLRRMSCLVQDDDTNDMYIVSKGSPESIRDCLRSGSIHTQYDRIAHTHTAKGLRVIALAIRKVSGNEKSKLESLKKDRVLAESELDLCGFALFDCPLKKDAADTITQLSNGSHSCVMITGDSCRTAVVVARKVNMMEESKLMMNNTPKTNNDDKTSSSSASSSSSYSEVYIAVTPGRDPKTGHPLPTDNNFEWCLMDGETMDIDRKNPLKKLPVNKTNNNGSSCFYYGAVDGDEISEAAFDNLLDTVSLDVLRLIRVWSRCPPTHKEKIVCALRQRLSNTVLMAGDGTNDVGGLKQAHVGIAVLNSSSFQATADDKNNNNNNQVTATATGANGQPQNPNGLPQPPPPLPPNSGFMDTMRHTMEQAKYQAAMQQHAQREKMKAASGDQQKKAESALDKIKKDKGLDTADAASAMTSLFNEMEDENEAPMVKLGDASIAAPFTCKSRKLTAVCDIVRLGRCTLVTTLQMYKIIALNCLVSAYTMAVLFTDGVKFSQTQMVSSGIVLAICFLLLSSSKPLTELSSRRPITRVFHPYMIVSIFGQFAVHLYSLASSVDLVQNSDPEGFTSQKGEDEEADFKPSLLNSIVFLMTTLMSVSTFAVNYKGRPFMTGLRDNKGMLILLSILTGLVMYSAFEFDPEFNKEFEITPFPSAEFREHFIKLLMIDVVGTWAVDFVAETVLGNF